MASKPIRIEGLATRGEGSLRYEPVKFVDTTFQNYAEKISSDYDEIIKGIVLPALDSGGELKLRDLRVLTSIYFFEVPITPAQVAEILRYDPATVSRSIKKLEDQGFVTRSDNGQDKRSVRLHLTESGAELGHDYTEAIDQTFSQLEDGLLYGLSADEKATFLKVMVKISRRAEAMKILANV